MCAATRHIVQLILKLGGEIIADIFLEKAFEKGCDETPAFIRRESVLLDRHIVAVFQNLQRRCVGGGTANAEFLHLLDQRRFGITRRGLGEMLFGFDRFLGRGGAFAHPRQALGFIIVVIVNAFFVEREIAGEEHDLPGRAQTRLAGSICHFDSGALHPGRGHLAGQRAFEDQIIKPGMIAATRTIH